SAQFEFIESGQERVVMYTRENEKESVLVVLNVQETSAFIQLPKAFEEATLVFGDPWTGSLPAYGAAVLVKPKK
ncbi:MAG: alpha-glucosidase C-terminal domain-containing protein, partial [Saprospiraceae bacterium]|nr:alpha-glucosidase C-terminal domain-containing protein [Saprospiraceae bacterium]